MSLKINSKLSLGGGGGVVLSLGIILGLVGFYVCIKYPFFIVWFAPITMIL